MSNANLNPDALRVAAVSTIITEVTPSITNSITSSTASTTTTKYIPPHLRQSQEPARQQQQEIKQQPNRAPVSYREFTKQYRAKQAQKTVKENKQLATSQYSQTLQAELLKQGDQKKYCKVDSLDFCPRCSTATQKMYLDRKDYDKYRRCLKCDIMMTTCCIHPRLIIHRQGNVLPPQREDMCFCPSTVIGILNV